MLSYSSVAIVDLFWMDRLTNAVSFVITSEMLIKIEQVDMRNNAATTIHMLGYMRQIALCIVLDLRFW
jgi:hypothetical protein